MFARIDMGVATIRMLEFKYVSLYFIEINAIYYYKHFLFHEREIYILKKIALIIFFPLIF